MGISEILQVGPLIKLHMFIYYIPTVAVSVRFPHITLPETNSSPLKIARAPKGNELVFQPSIFRSKLAVSFRADHLHPQILT